MKCPNCQHLAETALIKCSACGEIYDRTALEHFQHLEYVLKWLDERERAADLQASVHERLQGEASEQLEAARAALRLALPKPAAVPTPARAAPAASAPAAPVPIPAAAPVTPTSTPAEPLPAADPLARALALCEATRQLVPAWVEAQVIKQPAAHRLNFHLNQRITELRAGLAGRQITVAEATEEQVTQFAINSIAVWQMKGYFYSEEAEALRQYLDPRPAMLPAASTPAPLAVPASNPVAPTPIASAASAVPQPPPPPPAPPKPAQPPFDWGKVWERAWGLVVSGALLRGLLGLRSLMIVASAIVLVLTSWQRFPWPVQIGFIVAVPLTFYAGGFFLRSRFNNPVAGGAFTGIGALLVAVDFAAVYQIGGLQGQVDVRLYWLIASISCTAIYIFTALRVHGEFFAYLTLIGLTSVIVSMTTIVSLRPEWPIASAAASGAVMVAVAVGLRRRPAEAWGDLALAARRLPLLLLPLSLFLAVASALFAPGNSAFGSMAAFLFAAIGYGLLAEFFPAVFHIHAAAWCSIGAFGFALSGLALPREWYATVAATLAPLYIVTGRWFRQQLIDVLPPRRAYQGALSLVGFGLVGAAVLSGVITLIVDVWAGALALALAAVVLAWCAYFFRRPAFVFLAAWLFIAPVTIVTILQLYLAEALQLGAWLMTAWAALALAYLALAAGLRRAKDYVSWLHFWAQGLAVLIMLGLFINYAFSMVASRIWYNIPTLIALGGVVAVYVVSAILHDGGRHPGLSGWFEALPAKLRPGLFLWPVGALVPVWTAIMWWGTVLDRDWFGAALAGLALVYVGAGQLLHRHRPEHRLPPHVYAYLLSGAGLVVALNSQLPLMTTLCLAVAVLGVLAAIYRRAAESIIAALLFLWPFHLALQLLNVTPHGFSLAYALLAAGGYVPLGIRLKRVSRAFALPQYIIGYGLAALAVIASLAGRFNFYPINVPWVGVAVPALVTGLLIFSLYHFKKSPFAWAAAAVLPIAYGQALTLLQVPTAYDAAAWVGLAFAYLLIERGLAPTVSIGSLIDKIRERSQPFRWPLGLGVIGLSGLGLVLTSPATIRAFLSLSVPDYVAPLVAQVLAIGLVVSAARLYHSRWPLFVEPALAFSAVTVFFIGYSPSVFGVALTAVQFGLVWSVLGLAHLIVAAVLDRNQARYSHGLYLGGYALVTLAVLWTLPAREVLLWTLGLGILASIGSALLVHFNRHLAWDQLIQAVFGPQVTTLRSIVRGAFVWAAAWPFPIWCLLLLLQLNVADGFYWLGLGIPAILLLGLGAWLRRAERTYAWPLNTAAHFYTVLGLLISAPMTIAFLAGRLGLTPLTQLTATGFIILQTTAAIFYVGAARIHRTRIFTHVAAWLVFFPYTLVWILYSGLTRVNFAQAWLGLAAALLAIGAVLDRRPIRYAHGPYLAGYALAVFALAWSLPDRVVNLYTLGAAILLALGSHALQHSGWHRSFDDFVRFFWRKEGTVPRRAAQTAFLFFAAYAFPVWLAQFMTYQNTPLAWQGLGLALAAPIYIAFGLAARRVRAEYTWPLYSAGYALSAIGAMLSFENETLAIYVLILDAVVYFASAYIFRQAFWLYLANILVPIITLLTLHHNEALTAPWVAGLFMGLAFVYCGTGWWFNRHTPPGDSKHRVGTFALAWLAPAYGLSAIALAVASGGDIWLAIEIYSAGVVLYALSAWVWRESVFLYPAVWLVAVPYYLVMTLTLPLEWYGIGWLPLILTAIGIGKFVFHKTPLGSFWASIRAVWDAGSKHQTSFTHPALPFYLLAYALSVSMIVLSQPAALTFTIALTAGAILYFGSAALFRRAAWCYPALLAAHLALLTFFAISPSDKPAQYISLPFLGFTWLIALAGYFLNRRLPVTRSRETGGVTFKLGRWQLNLGSLPIVRHLLTPSWSQPFFIFTSLDVLVWQYVALGRHETAIIVATGLMLLLMVFAMAWRDSALAYGTLAFGLLALAYWLDWAGLPLADRFAILGGVGFGLYLLAQIAEWAGRVRAGEQTNRLARLTIWTKPLTRAAVFFTGLAVVATLPFVVAKTLAAAAALVFAGALYLTMAFRGRHYRLGYFAVALLQFAWVLVLSFVNVSQIQLYAIPAGLYFVGLGYLERRRSRRLFAVIIESFGLAVLLLTAFTLSLNGGAEGLPHFVLLLVEGMLVIWWGASRRLKAPFFIGLGASALNVAGQIVVLFGGGEQLTRWLIIGSAGLLIVTAAVFVERQRVSIIAKAQEWREALGTWE